MDAITNEPHTSLNVLIVDDNADAADSLETILRIWGYAARVAYDGEKGLAAAVSVPPDCIFLDINMPKMDGYAVAEKIRQCPAMDEVKLVALTGYSDVEHIKKMAQVGFDYYLNKTCTLADIRHLLETYGGSHNGAA